MVQMNYLWDLKLRNKHILYILGIHRECYCVDWIDDVYVLIWIWIYYDVFADTPIQQYGKAHQSKVSGDRLMSLKIRSQCNSRMFAEKRTLAIPEFAAKYSEIKQKKNQMSKQIQAIFQFNLRKEHSLQQQTQATSK